MTPSTTHAPYRRVALTLHFSFLKREDDDTVYLSAMMSHCIHLISRVNWELVSLSNHVADLMFSISNAKDRTSNNWLRMNEFLLLNNTRYKSMFSNIAFTKILYFKKLSTLFLEERERYSLRSYL